MKKTLGLTTLVLAALLAVVPASIGAQQNDPKNQNIPSLDFEQADIRDALKLLFDQVGVSYTIDPGVQGTVIAHLQNVTFETALRNLLNQVNATWRVEGGVYNIIVKPDPGSTTPDQGPIEAPNTVNPIVRIPVKSADPQLIVMMLKGEAGFDTQPEITGLTFGDLPAVGSSGGGGGFAGGGGGGFAGGGGFNSGGGGFNSGGGGFAGGGGFGGGGGGFGGGGGGFGR